MKHHKEHPREDDGQYVAEANDAEDAEESVSESVLVAAPRSL